MVHFKLASKQNLIIFRKIHNFKGRMSIFDMCNVLQKHRYIHFHTQCTCEVSCKFSRREASFLGKGKLWASICCIRVKLIIETHNFQYVMCLSGRQRKSFHHVHNHCSWNQEQKKKFDFLGPFSGYSPLLHIKKGSGGNTYLLITVDKGAHHISHRGESWACTGLNPHFMSIAVSSRGSVLITSDPPESKTGDIWRSALKTRLLKQWTSIASHSV